MASENDSHQQTKLGEVVPDSEITDEKNRKTEITDLVEQYLVSKQTTGSQAYAESAKSVLHRWAAWMNSNEYEISTLDNPQEGPRVMNEYGLQLAKRVQNDSLSPATAERYFAYVSACLSFGARQAHLKRNPALTDAATENLPERSRSDRTHQQFWSPEQRKAIVGFVDDQVKSHPTAGGSGRLIHVRNQALVRVLAYSGVRGAEILSHPKDDRDGRRGIQWKNIDFEAGTMLVFGKSQSWERTPLPTKCSGALRELKKVLDPPSEEWPVFTTGHRPSLYGIARDALGEQYDRSLAEVSGDIWDLLRTECIQPPALTTGGARKVMQRLSNQADIQVKDEYLKLHGGRRGLGDLLYRQDRGHAQDILRHKDLATTQSAYQHIDAEERRAQLDTHLEEQE